MIWLWLKLRLRKISKGCLFCRVIGKLCIEQAGEETDEKIEQQLSQGDLESDGMEATDDERIPLGDSDGFLTVLSRSRRKKQRREAEQDGQGEKALDDDPSSPPPVPTECVWTGWTQVCFVGTFSVVSLQITV